MKYFFSWCNCPVNNQHLKVKKTSLWSKCIKGSKERLFVRTTTRSVNFRGNPLCQATKWHLNNNEMVKKQWKIRWELEKRNNLSFMLSYVIFLSSAWKNIPFFMSGTECADFASKGPHMWQKCMLHHGPAFFFFSLVESEATCLHPEELRFKETSTCVAWVLTEQPCKAFWVCY